MKHFALLFRMRFREMLGKFGDGAVFIPCRHDLIDKLLMRAEQSDLRGERCFWDIEQARSVCAYVLVATLCAVNDMGDATVRACIAGDIGRSRFVA